MLHEGSIHLTTVSILGPCLTQENHRELLTTARHMGKEKLLLLAASVEPKPDVPSTIRKLPAHGGEPTIVFGDQREPELLLTLESEAWPAGNSLETKFSKSQSEAGEVPATAPSLPIPARKAVMAPLSAERYRVQFTASEETTWKVKQLQELLRHQIPNGDPAIIFERAIDLFFEYVERGRFAKVDHPRNGAREGSTGKSPCGEPREAPSRHIPARVKRAVWSRDGAQCAFVARSGQRCSERGWLEFHHLDPYGWGGPATIENLALRCRAHNAFEGERVFGKFAKSKGANASASSDQIHSR